MLIWIFKILPYLGKVSRHFYIGTLRLAQQVRSTRYVLLRIVVQELRWADNFDNFTVLNTFDDPYGLMRG